MQSILEKENSALSVALNFLDNTVGNAANAKRVKDDTYLGGSIAKYTQDLIMTFPTMFDTSLAPTTAGIISKAHERNVVTMLQLLFGAMQVKASSGREAIQKVHSNLKMNDIVALIDSMREQTNLNTINGVRTSDALNEMTMYLKTRPKKSYPVNSFRNRSLNEYIVMKDRFGNNVVKEADDPFAAARNARDERRDHREEQSFALTRVMSDQDYRKVNELAPTLLVITFNEITDDGSPLKGSFAAGVKSRLIPVESIDIIERIAAKKNTAINFTNLIRATTGEISFTKDFLFCVSQSKINAKNAAKRGPVAQMWNVLDRRHAKNKFNDYRKSGNDAAAITALVVNQETANMIKKEYNFDLENYKNANYIITEYNLLALILCDESVEVAKFFYHGNDHFEQLPYSFLERENNDAKAYKDVINLFNKSGR